MSVALPISRVSWLACISDSVSTCVARRVKALCSVATEFLQEKSRGDGQSDRKGEKEDKEGKKGGCCLMSMDRDLNAEEREKKAKS